MLEDGTVFYGRSVGSNGVSVGEIVFHTSMSGYQEIITDPSYASQIVVFTYPHIGNTGINSCDSESSRVWVSGMVMRDFIEIGSSYRMEKSLRAYLDENNTLAVSGIDTRCLTQHIRKYGSLKGCLMCGNINEVLALDLIQAFNANMNFNLIDKVTCREAYRYNPNNAPNRFFSESTKLDQIDKYRVVVYDFGVKNSILNCLVAKGLEVMVVPSHTPVAYIVRLKPDGIVLSNGPGDPRAYLPLIAKVEEILQTKIPTLAICLGHQLLALACGAKVFKMKFGHHGANHPVYDYGRSAVIISSQNHNYAVSDEDLPDTLYVTSRSLFDNTIQGLKHKHFDAMGFQGHPEGGPGPRDGNYLFDCFLECIKKNKKNATKR
ncbi:glutamine-hydrolyzing carbamoyl-phosphate synthase small subunit [Cardinium endosymbiont of Oedothorax gibbosus]|uniref:glutamine-hydrolyzing carbamoyl-phosphate synthase small subunit n=1 Tax=Cardinium endosymbiont of Oedothorax gibbosus TaxID=931101 RepID=UPI0020252CBA|nr:glutamine-hydrolyzing carbamoyl-phosphate synthase small subunit [Cardinium endosymbiont of Oedothorax gibbosus]CAH2559762.1 Carbamoyl-phosphate synthase small chain [Cardinium endosymbiont of Oedothorax gibbosus]